MQRRGAGRGTRKVQGTRKPKANRKTSVVRSAIDHPEEGLVQRLRRERDEALELQSASADVLRIIGAFPGDLNPVFEAMLGSALRICDAKFGHILLYDGERFDATHLHNVPPSYRSFWDKHRPIRPNPNTGLGRIVSTKQVVHIPNLLVDSAYAEREPLRVATVEQAGARSFIAVPMLKDSILIGAIVIYRQEVRPFAEKQIELLKNFAAQAVIAIENTRLFNETKKAMERQAAMADILKVIASSPDNVQPVFDAIAQSAKRLFGAHTAVVTRVIGDMIHLAAFSLGNQAGNEALQRSFPFPLSTPDIHTRVVRTGAVEFRTDILNEPNVPPGAKVVARARGYRSILVVPMLRESNAIGTIVVTRPDPGPFSKIEIELLQTFADHAVIAIENARLFNETKESLQQQAATADVLKVISRSAFELQTVLETLIRSAVELSGAFRGTIYLRDGDLFHFRAASYEDINPAWLDFLRSNPVRAGRHSAAARAIASGQTVCIPDLLADPEIQIPANALAGIRAVLAVPLLRDGKVEGVMVLSRQTPGPFTVRQIELVQTFADQAVIAIENARLFEEVQAKTRNLEESLQHQTASAEVLQVIGKSMADPRPVFERIVDSVARLFDHKQIAIFLAPGDGMLHVAARRGLNMEVLDAVYPMPIAQTSAPIVLEAKQQVYYADVLNGADVPESIRLASEKTGSNFSNVSTPMLWKGHGVGVIAVTREPNVPFSERELSLLRTFADQAVIAIENARLFNETQEALERQTATADILKVIASSPDDVQPVFQAIADRSKQLVDALSTTVFRLVDGMSHLRAFTPTTPQADAKLQATFPAPLSTFSWGEAIEKGEIYRASMRNKNLNACAN